jgi:hypothetical protein
MKYPCVSFICGILLYLILVFLISFSFFQKNEAPLVSLTIDANMIGEINAHQISKAKEQKSQNLEKISQEKKYQKSLEEKIEPSDENPALEEKEEFKNISQKIAPIYQPLPKIPDELRHEAFNSRAVARFFVLKNGVVKTVELIRPSASPKLNYLLLKSLHEWKFPANSSGFIQEINVTFRVE